MVGLLAGAAKGLLKKPKKVDPKKFAGKMEETKASSKPKGGALAVRPVESIVKVVDIKPKDGKVNAKGGPLAEIQEGVHSIVLALRDEQKAKKKRLVLKRKNQEKKKRLNLEALSELGKTTGKIAGGLASATGITNLWGAIWKTLGILFAGWAMNFLPQILEFVKKFVDITTNVVRVAQPIVGFIWDTLTWITDKGVKLLAMVSGIKPEEALDNSIIKNLTEIQKRIPLLEAAFAWFAILKLKKSFGGGGGPRRGIVNTLKRTKKLIQRRFFDPKRAQKLDRLKNIKKLKLEKLANDNVAKNVGKSNWFGKVKGFGKNLWTKGGQIKNFLGKQGRSFLNWADDFGKNFMASADEIIKGVSARASNWAKSIGDIAEMAKNPAKLVEKVKSVLGGQLDDVVKQNKTVAKIVNLAKNPKEITKGIKGLLNNAKKSKGLLQLRQGLKGAQKMKIGGIDKVIAAIMGLLDYTVFKESPINAILRAIGGLLGYTAGFAIGAPFGGAPGFITGMAGGFVGEKVAMLIAKGLAKTKLGEIQDPIMNDGRMLVRDPDDAGMNEELHAAQLEHGLGDDEKFNALEEESLKEESESTADSLKPNGNAAKEKSNDASLISKSASYDENGGKSTIIPVPIGDMQSGSSGGTTLVGAGDGVNTYETVNKLNKTGTLSKHFSD